MLANLLNNRRAYSSRLNHNHQATNVRWIIEIVAALGVGVLLGTLLVYSRQLSATWRGLVVLGAFVPTAVLVFGNLDKLILIVLVVDIPLGLDIALSHQLGFSGGISGYVISLMSLALVVGYVRWLAPGSSPRRVKINPQWDITLPALVYLILILVSSFYAIDYRFSFFSAFFHLQLFLMYFYVLNHVNDKNHLRLVFTVLMVSLLLESMLMLLQYLTGLQLSVLSVASRSGESDIAGASARVGGTLGPPNTAATFLATSLPIILAVHLSNRSSIDMSLTLPALLLGFAALLTTQSRMGLIMCAIAFSIVAAVAVWRRYRTRALWPLIVIALLVGVGFSRQIVDRFANSGQVSALSRVWYGELAFNVIEDNMFTGIGANNQRFIIDDIDYIPMELLGRDRTLIHNKYLSTWVETGFFGLLAFIWLLLAAARRAILTLIRSKSAWLSVVMAGLLAALVAYSMHMSVATFTGRARIQLLWLLLALIAATSQIVKRQASSLD